MVTARSLIFEISSVSVFAANPSLNASCLKLSSMQDQSSSRNISSLIPVSLVYLAHSCRKKLQSDSLIPAFTVGLVGLMALAEDGDGG